MLDGKRRDLARQAANVAGALFQVGMTAYAAAGIREVTDQRTPLIEPALYAFFVWGPIFLFSLAYAVYQALPRLRSSTLLRRIGWFTAGAFLSTGLWSVLVPDRRTLAALAVFVAAWACLAVAFVRIAAAGRTAGVAVGTLVATPVGVFLGWVTAAVLVSTSSELVKGGVLAPGGGGEAAVGAALLLLGGLLAGALVRIGKRGPRSLVVSFAGTVGWALLGIVVNQYEASPVTALAAIVAAVPIVAALGDRIPFPPRPPRWLRASSPTASA